MTSSLTVYAEPVQVQPQTVTEEAPEQTEEISVQSNEQTEEETDEASETQGESTEAPAEDAEDSKEEQDGQPEEEEEEQVQAALSIESVNYAAGTAQAVITGIAPSADVKRVTVPTWSKEGQSDISWYEASYKDGAYRATINVANHKYNTGVYNVHAYYEDAAGTLHFINSQTVDFTAKNAQVSVQKTASGYKVSVSGISVPGGITGVTFPVWSEDGGQDDIEWFNGSYNSSNGTASVEYKASEFSSFGKYFAHVYGKNHAGNLVYLGETEYTVSAPSAESVEVTADNSTGKFTVKISGVKSDSGISKIQVPTWSESNGQDDIKWYNAVKQNDGSYTVSGSIADHGYGMGVYNFHAYVVDSNGYMGFVGKTTAEYSAKSSAVTVNADKENVKYTASISDVQIPGGVKSVVFAIWSDANGQDDIKWYDASKSGNTYKVTFDIANHRSQGIYHVHAYGRSATGSLVYLNENNDTMVSNAFTAYVTAENFNTANGTFDVYVTVEGSSTAISKIQVPVWSEAGGQDDIKWYGVTKQSDGRFKCTVSIADHKYDVGKYNVHVYLTFENGIMNYACETVADINPQNYLYVQKTSNGHRDIVIKNVPSGTSQVTFAVWSETNGQDDIQWIKAAKQSDGSYKASVSLSSFKSPGTFNAHAYKNMGTSSQEFLTKTTFSVASNEIAKNGWYYEGGYKFYYENGAKLTDVRSKLGAQSTYKIEVNRTCNTVTIYAKDGSNGYIIPVVAFACSVGLPQTPTYTGNYTVGAKYRWKMLMGPSWGQYATTVSGQSGVYFHSVAGANTTSYNLSAVEYNKLGSAASHGCIRLNVRDAKWIYDNVPAGSSIRIYDSSTAGPLGKPVTIKIPPNQNWDPTDPAITG
jgi:lipoprotein-anchoring transpeptidase ErfK/SrfK